MLVYTVYMDRISRLKAQYEKSGFHFRMDPYLTKSVRITMWAGRSKPIQTVASKDSIGVVLLAMRNLLNKRTFCETCGGIK